MDGFDFFVGYGLHLHHNFKPIIKLFAVNIISRISY